MIKMLLLYIDLPGSAKGGRNFALQHSGR